MASWMVHLRIADNLLNLIEGLEPVYFAIGNVATDSGIPDENWENFDPPPELLHFQKSNADLWHLADLDFYRQHLLPYKGKFIEPDRFAFLLGYFFHLVIDNLWRENIDNPTRKRFASEFEADKDFIWQVKRDWYGLDFEYVRSQPDSIFWRIFVDCEYAKDYLEFLPREAVQLRLEYIKELYQRTDEKIEEWYVNRPKLYLNKKEMDDFIDVTTAILQRIYKILWVDGVEISNLSSSLELIRFNENI